MEKWNDGMVGILVQNFLEPNIPVFQYSTIPV
jgi:hypothetical protein